MALANSFKKMTKEGVIKRTDTGMFISLDDIHIREGFNKREDGDRTREAAEELFNFMLNGGRVPPLEVTAREEGGVWVVEGHRRTAAYTRLKESGKPVDKVHIMPFVGNDVDRLARIMTSNSQLPLTPYEQAGVVKELAAFNLSTAEIAKLVNKSPAHVDKLLTLASANHDVQSGVKSGEVSLSVAASRVKEFGDGAGEVIEKDKARAKAEGKARVTGSVIKRQLSVGKLKRIAELVSVAGEYDSFHGLSDLQVAELNDLLSQFREFNG